MTRAFKAAIFNPDRTLSVHYIGKKLRVGPTLFKLKKKGNSELYLIDPAHSLTTITKRMMIPFKYTTCYYRRNTPVPVPMEDADGGKVEATVAIAGRKEKLDLNKIVAVDTILKIDIIKPITAPTFGEWKYPTTGISSEELEKLFNPQFYTMIARANVNKKQEQMFLMQAVNLAASAFIIYDLMQLLPKAITKAVSILLHGGT